MAINWCSVYWCVCFLQFRFVYLRKNSFQYSQFHSLLRFGSPSTTFLTEKIDCKSINQLLRFIVFFFCVSSFFSSAFHRFFYFAFHRFLNSAFHRFFKILRFIVFFSCWIRPDYITFAVILPTSLIIITDVVCTALIIQQFYFNRVNTDRHSRRIQSHSAQKRQRAQKVTVLISMQIILGAPWVGMVFVQ